MDSSKSGRPVSQSKLRLIAGLLAVSTLLFVAGVALERGWEVTESATGTHTESAAGESHSEEGESAAHRKAEGHSEESEAGHEEAAHTEPDATVAGLDLESPWAVGAMVLVSLALIVALLRFGYPVLPWVVAFALLGALFDLREVSHQLQEGRTDIAFLAASVAITHLLAGGIALVAYREGVSGQPPEAEPLGE